MVENVVFTTTTQENFEHFLNKNGKLRRELVAMKKKVENLATEN